MRAEKTRSGKPTAFISQCRRRTEPALLLVHGTGSSGALALASSATQLAYHYDVYAIDLPELWRSKAPKDIILQDSATIASQYALCFLRYARSS
jgi:pimeloyl-ACP methyl ester carboxylesterase